MFKQCLLLTFSLCTVLSARAESWYEKKVAGVLLYDSFKQAGVPVEALERTFEFLDLNENKEFQVELKDKTVTKNIANKNYAVIIDYSKPSSERRLFLLDLKTGKAEKYFVAHGRGTGMNDAVKFSNKQDSMQTSLGLFITGSEYFGKHGKSLYLHGIEASNSNAFKRDIVMHGASYVSMEVLQLQGRMGRSLGCPAVSKEILPKILPLIKDGAVVYAYHKDLMSVAQASPAVQEVSKDKQAAADNDDKLASKKIDE